jgi:hypothetical protein
MVVLLLVIALLGSPFIVLYLEIGVAVWQSNRERAQLLYRTDHKALLTACRAIIKNRQSFARDQDWNGPQDREESFIDPHDPKVPADIARLKPRDIIASDDQVKLELHGGFDHYGVIAESESARHSASDGLSGPFELVPGLWYYDAGLACDQHGWMAKLRWMKPNHVAAPPWFDTARP